MAERTTLDELVNFPAIALTKIGEDTNVVQLLVDDTDVDDDDVDDVFQKYLFDYGYVDETTTEAAAYVCVEAELNRILSPTMQSMRLYVTIFCHKDFMELDPEKFAGMMGNRRDNLVRFVNDVIDNSNLFGVGNLKLQSVKTISTPAGFTGRELTYQVPDFSIPSGANGAI